MTRQRLQLAVLALAVTVLAPGCSVYRFGKLSTLIEPHVYHQDRDRRASLAVYRSLADEALATFGAACPDGLSPGDFQWGFREGFAQFVYAGGDGSPPAVPPRVYWQVDKRTPEGAAAVESWFEGYRVGARVAREGGYRETATIAVSASVHDVRVQGVYADGSNSPSDDPFFNDDSTEHPELLQPVLPTPTGPTLIEEPGDLTEELPPPPQPALVLPPPRQTRLKARPIHKANRNRINRNDGSEQSEVLSAAFDLTIQAERSTRAEQLPQLKASASTHAGPTKRRNAATAARPGTNGPSKDEASDWRPRSPHAVVRAYAPIR